jgi:hypothetical protein
VLPFSFGANNLNVKWCRGIRHRLIDFPSAHDMIAFLLNHRHHFLEEGLELLRRYISLAEFIQDVYVQDADIGMGRLIRRGSAF